jgi:hypothetical protein
MGSSKCLRFDRRHMRYGYWLWRRLQRYGGYRWCRGSRSRQSAGNWGSRERSFERSRVCLARVTLMPPVGLSVRRWLLLAHPNRDRRADRSLSPTVLAEAPMASRWSLNATMLAGVTRSTSPCPRKAANSYDSFRRCFPSGRPPWPLSTNLQAGP